MILVHRYDDSTVSITNAGAKRCDNQCRFHLDKMFFFYMDPVYIVMRENHTDQMNLFLFCEMDKKEQIDLYIFLRQ